LEIPHLLIDAYVFDDVVTVGFTGPRTLSREHGIDRDIDETFLAVEDDFLHLEQLVNGQLNCLAQCETLHQGIPEGKLFGASTRNGYRRAVGAKHSDLVELSGLAIADLLGRSYEDERLRVGTRSRSVQNRPSVVWDIGGGRKTAGERGTHGGSIGGDSFVRDAYTP
jgi:hypothetical protein